MRIGKTPAYRIEPIQPIGKTGSATQKPKDMPQRKEQPKGGQEGRAEEVASESRENVEALTSWWQVAIGHVFGERRQPSRPDSEAPKGIDIRA